MHLVIALQAAQCGADSLRQRALDLVQALLRQPGAPAHTATIVLDTRFGAHIETIRCALAPLVPPERFAALTLPAEQGQAAMTEAAAHIGAAFLAALDPDAILSIDCGTGPAPLRASASAACPHAILVLDADAPAPDLARASAWSAADRLLGPDAASAEALWQVLATLPAPAQPALPARARLAYVSPLPPEKSGIADYSAELLPQLARYYDIEVIVDQDTISDPWISANLSVRSLAWFEQHGDSFDHRLYHVGNSPMHRHMFALLARFAGVVVLHDFYLGNLLHYMHHSGYQADALQNALFRSHGFGALLDGDQIGESAVVWKYPCNGDILAHASGVIVHSAYPRQLAERWYGPGAAAHWRTLPLLRGGAVDDAAAARRAARAELGIADDEFLVCSFGMLGQTKLNDRLLDAWLASPLAGERQCRLVYVGELAGGNYGRDLQAKIGATRARKRIAITGFASPQLYRTYLAACDVAVQLRSESRGETSASVLDCLLHGVPTIANAHGASAELPADALCMLDDDFTTEALADALLTLRADAGARQRLGQAGADLIAREHSPQQVGLAYRDAIDHFYRNSAQQRYRSLVQRLRALPLPGRDALRDCALAIAANGAPRAPRQLLIDVSALVQTDLRTGIQRVVRSVLHALLAEPPAGYRVEPVYSPGGGQAYRYARAFMQGALVVPVHDLDDAPIEVQRGDIFLGLDLMMHGVHQNRDLLQSYRDRGMAVHFVVYDMLPLLMPHCFPFGADAGFADWVDTIATVSDGLVCISRSVADEVAAWLDTHPVTRLRPLQLGYFHLGADIGASAPTSGLPDGADEVLARVASRPSLLMVGTVEPRKGHALALAALELLWAEGVAVNLIIVGKHGWMVDALAQRLKDHPEHGQRLFWLQGVSDEMLLKLYRGSSALLAASEGEGFGLPLIEAAQHGLPLIARDLPVFREVGGEHAYYVDGSSAAALAESLRRWLALQAAGQAPGSADMPWLTWRASAAQLLENIIGQRWYRSLAPAPH